MYYEKKDSDTTGSSAWGLAVRQAHVEAITAGVVSAVWLAAGIVAALVAAWCARQLDNAEEQAAALVVGGLMGAFSLAVAVDFALISAEGFMNPGWIAIKLLKGMI